VCPVVQHGDIRRSAREECLLKKIDASAQIGDGGIALIHQLVNKMGFTWHERKTDTGIDGEIELRNPVTGEVANRLILIQSKASDRRFPGENDRSFHFLCKLALPFFIAGQEGRGGPLSRDQHDVGKASGGEASRHA
jgi:hypothetical protein